jgi:signal transduction histidine kinase
VTLIVVSKLILQRANRPFFQLLDVLRKFRLDNSRIPDFPETNIAEYTQLNETVRELLERNIRTFTEQKEFIENSSHELQTPLAIAIAKLELLLEKYREDESHAGAIAAILQTLNRMKRLNSRLLLLSKIRNNQFPAVSSVNLRETLEATLADFAEIAEYRQITIEMTGTVGPSWQMNEDLTTVLFSNLIKNAIVHNARGGKMTVACYADRICISNSGTAPITPVFSRYHSDKSSGLGLSIAKSIAALYKIDLTYRFENGLHIFELRLK